MADKDIDLQEGYDDVTTALAKYNELLTRAGDPTGVLVRTRHGITDNKYYKVDPLSLKIVNKVDKENRSYHVARCRLYQLS
jgi:hypothetical protein